MKKQCRVTGVSSPSLHGPLRQRCSSRRRICSPEGNTTTNCSPKTPHSLTNPNTLHLNSTLHVITYRLTFQVTVTLYNQFRF
ncbi:uncharacterized [Tachysurus ichikawai]